MNHEANTWTQSMDTRVIVVVVFVLLYVPVVVDYGIGYRDAAQVDLEAFYWASVVTFEQDGSPYGPDAFAGIQSVWEGTVNPYWYPPPSLLIFYPLSWFGYDVTRILTLIVNHMLLLLFLWLLVFRALKLRWRQSDVPMLIVTFVLALTYYPINSTIYHGQVNLAVGVCLLLFWVGLREGRGSMAVAVPLAAAILLKSYPIVFLAVLLHQKRYRTALWTLGCLAVVVLAALSLVPAVAWNDWWTKIVPGGGYGVALAGLESPSAPWNQSINGFCSRLFYGGPHSGALVFSPLLARFLTYLLSAVVVVVSVWSVRRRRSRNLDWPDWDWLVSLLLVVLYLIAPFTWEHHGVFILPAILVALIRMLPVWATRKLIMIALVLAAGILACLIARSPRPRTRLGPRTTWAVEP